MRGIVAVGWIHLARSGVRAYHATVTQEQIAIDLNHFMIQINRVNLLYCNM